MTKQSAQPITERDLARKLTETFGVREWKPVIDIIKEVTGREFAPEPKPLPTEPGSAIIATEVRGEKGEWRMMLDRDGVWFSPAMINGDWYHQPEHITAWTPARVVPEGEPSTPEGEPISLDDVQVGDRVRAVFTDGDVWEVGVSAARRDSIRTTTDLRIYHENIRTIHLLHREEA